MSHLAIPLRILSILLSQEPHPSLADRSAFLAAKAQADEDPARLVKLALWCESRGMVAERRAALQQAIRLDPNNPAAHGLLNQIRHRGRWVPPEAIGREMKEDAALRARLAEYNARRGQVDRDTETERREIAAFEKANNFAKAGELKHILDRRLAPEHVRLGLWCDQNGLKAEAQAHFTMALHLNPHDPATWRHLGYVPHHGRWMSREQIAAEEHEALAEKHAEHHWLPVLHRLEIALRDRRRRARAEEELAKINDPRSIPAIVRTFGEATPAGQRMIVRLLGQIDAPASSSRLAGLAIFGETPEVRQAAALALKGREPRDYAGWLVALIRTPMTYQAKPVGGPGTKGSLVIDSPRFRITRTYETPPDFRLNPSFRNYIGIDSNGLPAYMTSTEMRHFRQATAGGDPRRIQFGAMEEILRRAEMRYAAMLTEVEMGAAAARQRLAADVRELEELNAEATELNRRATAVLRAAADAPPDLDPDDEDAWNSWYYDRIGYRYLPPPKVIAPINQAPQVAAPVLASCFVAGTAVRTIEGTRPIESIRTGDQVLSRDVASGTLEVRPVLAVHRHPRILTLRIAFDPGGELVATAYDRFWRPGRGWAMARDLRPGEVLRTLDGLARIASIEPAPDRPVFQLDVAGSHTFFAGAAAALVHDNTPPPPHPTAPPFDLVAEPAAPHH